MKTFKFLYRYLVFGLIFILLIIINTIRVFAYNFELPLKGASGFLSVDFKEYKAGDSFVILVAGEDLKEKDSNNRLYTANAGRIEEENFEDYSSKSMSYGVFFDLDSLKEDELLVCMDKNHYILPIPKDKIMINLPDVIPSIIYKNSNGEKSLFKTSNENIPNLTGEKLYTSKFYNSRLKKDEYVMPVMYDMAKKIYKMQKAALKRNYSLVIYETYRPLDTQVLVRDKLNEKISSSEKLQYNINFDEFGNSWGKSWFIAQKYSNHQRGVAFDVSLAKINKTSFKNYKLTNYLVIDDYTEFEMPSNMHELSTLAVIMNKNIDVKNIDLKDDSRFNGKQTDGAVILQELAGENGLSPLLSEWWHFNDLETKDNLRSLCVGNFKVHETKSY